MTQAFYNSNNLTGSDLKRAVENAINQEQAIMIVYKETRKKLTPWDIHGMMTRAGKKFPITSCRRAITNLMQKGELIKTSDMKPGEYGSPETFYQLNFIKYPTQTNVQQPELFGYQPVINNKQTIKIKIMNFHKISLQATAEGFLTKRKVEDGFLIGMVYPKDRQVNTGDILVHQEHFTVNEKNEVVLLQVSEINEERPAKGTWASEEARPTYRRIKAVRKTFQSKELIDAGVIRVEQKYDEVKRKNIDVLKLAAA